jgi:hypothetical protein
VFLTFFYNLEFSKFNFSMKKFNIICLGFIFLTSISFGQWLSINPLNVQRSSHVSEMFTNGAILVAGGFGESIQTKTAELYDPSTGIWSNTPAEMSAFHSSGTATLLPSSGSEKILIAGGWTGSINTSECELYDRNTNSWSTASSMLSGRSDHSATFSNGKVLVVGGYNGAVNLTSCELYDPLTNAWTEAGSLITGRSSHTATRLSNGKILVTGGYNPNAGYQLSSTEIYDPATNTWSQGPEMSTVRNQHAATLLADGNVLIAGGEQFTGAIPYAYEGTTSVDLYNFTTNTISPVEQLPTGLSYLKMVSVGNVALVIGGKEKTDYFDGIFTSTPGKTYLYHVSSNSWIERPMNLGARIYFTAHKTFDNKAIVIGGQTDEVELYDLTAGLTNIEEEIFYTVAPNPATSMLSLTIYNDLQDNHFKIKDVSGRPISVLFNQVNDCVHFDVSVLNTGVYFLEITHNSKVSSLRFVKE